MARIDRINHQMKKEISDIVLREMNDPRVEFVTITEVLVSRDLQHAKVYFSVLGNESQARKAEEGLLSARGLVRKLIGERIRMRYTPEIQFIYDESIATSARIETMLGKINRESDKDYHNN